MYAYVGNNPVNKRDPTGLDDNFNLCMMLCSSGGCAAVCGSAALSGPIGAAFAVACGVACGYFGCGLLCAMVFGDDSGLMPPGGYNPPGCDPQSHQCVR